MSTAEINALITLLEDPDQSIFDQIKRAIVKKGEAVVPQLQHYGEYNNYGDLFQKRIEDLIQSIKYNSAKDGLIAWKENDNNDLLEGALLISQSQNPSFTEQEVREKISQIRQDIWLELNDELTAFEIVNVFNHILYTIHGFEGNKKDFISPSCKSARHI
ncbi:MAG: hypothetical protein ACPGWM_07325 [Flavobacteriales bacterium]